MPRMAFLASLQAAQAYRRLVPLRSLGERFGKVKAMRINVAQPFKGRQYAGEIILTAVRWYLRYPLA
jgi:hypothetical protein